MRLNLQRRCAFTAVKFCGYSFAGRLLAKEYKRPANLMWKVGTVRTIIGIVTGAAYFALWAYVLHVPLSELFWYLGLVPVRMLEWGLLLRIFFEPALLSSAASWQYAAIGTVWSFIFDAIGVGAALVVPGGM